MNENTNVSPVSTIEIYSDGSGNTIKSDGGYGWRIVADGFFVKEGSGYLPIATNNVAEVSGAIEGLKAVKALVQQNHWQMAKVILVADSQLVLGYATGNFRCKAEHLKPLAAELKRLYNELDADTRWVRGHTGDEHNEAVDKLAGNARLYKTAVV